MLGQSGQLPDGQKTSMGWEDGLGLGGDSTKSVWPHGAWIRLNVEAWWGRENCLAW